MPNELKPCPYCGGKAIVNPFICRIEELPKPIPLFGRWSLIKMRYREIPCLYTVDCDNLCDGFLEGVIHIVNDTKEGAIKAWNEVADNDR